MGEKIYIADKETLDKVYNILASDPVFGFIEHNSILSPGSRIEYIGLNKDYAPLVRNKTNGSMALNSWADFPLIKANKPYMVRADGTPDYRLKETDYTQRESGGASDDHCPQAHGFSILRRVLPADLPSVIPMDR